MRITAGGSSRKGGHRKQNEDAWRVYQDQAMVRRAGRGTIYAVADGVGGTGAGRYASWQVVDSLAFFFNAPASATFDPGEMLRQVLVRCNDALRTLAAENREYTMAGSTLALLYAMPDLSKGFVFSIGDSGVFLLRRGALLQLNEDHRDERGKVTSFVGMPGRLTVSTRVIRLDDDDRILLCTDGVREMVDLQAIQDVLERDAHPDDVADTLTAMTEAAGGLDNATAVVVRVGDCPPSSMSDDASE